MLRSTGPCASTLIRSRFARVWRIGHPDLQRPLFCWFSLLGPHVHPVVCVVGTVGAPERGLVGQGWGHGFVHIKLLGNLPVGSTDLGEARRAAGYLSKYVAKTFTDPAARVLGLHRYDVAQGFKPLPVALTGRTADDVLAQASGVFGVAPSSEWASSSVEDWQGPPAIWAQ